MFYVPDLPALVVLVDYSSYFPIKRKPIIASGKKEGYNFHVLISHSYSLQKSRPYSIWQYNPCIKQLLVRYLCDSKGSNHIKK